MANNEFQFFNLSFTNYRISLMKFSILLAYYYRRTVLLWAYKLRIKVSNHEGKKI